MSKKPRYIAVVGAAGGVGRHTVQALLDKGHRVLAIDRVSPSSYDELKELANHTEVEWHQVEIDQAPLVKLLTGVDVVVNAAGDVGLSESYSQIVVSNVVAVDKLFNAAKTAKVKQFVHISSGTIYKPAQKIHTEEDEIDGSNDFNRSKIDSEVILQANQTPDTHWTILRPSYIYGPGCRSMAAGLVTLPPILGDFFKYQPGFRSGARTTWCHVEDLARAITCVIGNEDAYEQIFNVADNTPQAAGECITAITEAYGLQIGVVIPLPTALLLNVAQKLLKSPSFEHSVKTLLRQLWRRVCLRHRIHSPLKPRLSPLAANHLAYDLTLDNRKLVAMGWSPKWPSFSSGIPSTIAWYQEHNWVPTFDRGSMKRIEVESKPLPFSFEQTLTGSLHLSSHYRNKLPLREAIQSKQEILQRLDLTKDSKILSMTEGEVVIQIEVVLRSLLKASGNINGQVWIAGITSQPVNHQGTYLFDWQKNQFLIDLGFKDKLGLSYRAVLHGQRGNLLSAITKQTFPPEFHGRLYDRQGDTVGNLTLSLEIAETMLSILFGLR